MKFYFILNKSPLYYAIEKENIEIIKLLVASQNIDINFKNVFINILNKIF